jgi:hypothetical protein
MSGYVARLATRLDEILQRFRASARELRDELSGSASHRRVPDMIGELLAAFNIFMEFVVESGAISSEESEPIRSRCRRALLDSAERQDAHQAAADPAERFISLIGSVISSGRGHVAGIDGKAPDEPHSPSAWGWRWMGDGVGWREQGRCIGWIDGDDLLLDPGAAFAEANGLASAQGEAFGVGLNTLYKRLEEGHLLASTDPGRHNTRWTIQGARRRVLHLRPSTILESGPSGPSGPVAEKQAEHGPLSGTALSVAPEKRSAKSVQNPAENGVGGPVGPIGPLPRADESHVRAGGDGGPGRDGIDRRQPADLKGGRVVRIT